MKWWIFLINLYIYDRYDGRGHLYNQEEFDQGDRIASFAMTKEEELFENELNRERYLALEQNLVEESFREGIKVCLWAFWKFDKFLWQRFSCLSDLLIWQWKQEFYFSRNSSKLQNVHKMKFNILRIAAKFDVVFRTWTLESSQIPTYLWMLTKAYICKNACDFSKNS